VDFKIIQTELELEDFKQKIKNRNVFLHCIPVSSYKHPCSDEISIIFVKSISNDVTYAICINHTDTLSDIPVSRCCQILNTMTNKRYVVNKKSFCQLCDVCDTLDVQILGYLNNIEINTEINLPVHNFYRFNFRECNILNTIIPLNKHLEIFEQIYAKVNEVLNSESNRLHLQSFLGLNDNILDTLCQIEKNGLFVDVEKFGRSFSTEKTKHINDNLIYSQYNILTSTGRPSNAFDGINFAALNKDDDTRECFISRFGNDGKLIDFDFTAFHPHLIANLINYDIDPDLNIYEYLGTYYFHKKKLNIVELNNSKSLTFRQLYGGVEHKYKNIPYFKKWNEYITQRWDFFLENGYVETPVYSRQINLDHIGDDVNPSKLSNYILQAYETEHALGITKDVNMLLKNSKSKIVLYTYDSILIDFHKDDGIDLVREIKRIMMYNNKFPIKIKAGNNYKQLQKLKV